MRPLGHKAYGSIPHLPGSKLGPGDHHLDPQQAAILTGERKVGRDWAIVVQEKLDGSCMSVAKIDGQIVALTRSGFLAESSPYEHLRLFAPWVERRRDRFDALLSEGERVVGEWMLLATAIRYWIPAEDDLFVAFDIMRGHERATPDDVFVRCYDEGVQSEYRLWSAPIQPLALFDAFERGRFHACEPPEGLIYRAIRNGKVAFLAKWVRADFEPGRYLGQDVYNYPPQWLRATEAA